MNRKRNMENKMIQRMITKSMLTLLLGVGIGGAAWSAELSWQRNVEDFSELPTVEIFNSDAAPASGSLRFTLTDSALQTVFSETVPYQVAPGERVAISRWKERAPQETIVLCEVSDEAESLKPTGVSGIFGKAQPFDRTQPRQVGMNVHLERYSPQERWKLLTMLREAGVTTVRMDCEFGDPESEPERVAQRMFEVEEVLLAMEAFQMAPLIAICYFSDALEKSDAKVKMCYDFSRYISNRFAGRADYQYGNETNSGWGAFGAAEDMGQLHKGYALGTAAGDPTAKRSSFGIAEALPGYTKAFLQSGADQYMEALCAHPYSGTPEAGISKLLAERALLHPDQELWATEFGFHVDERSGALNPTTMAMTQVMGCSLEQQAHHIGRVYILGKSVGIDRIYWYDFFGKNDPETFYLVNADDTPRPGYLALKQVSNVLKNSVPLGGTPLSEFVQRHYFRRADGRVICYIWAQQKPQQFEAAYLNGCRVYDLFGKELEHQDGTPLALSEMPLLVELPEHTVFRQFENLEMTLSAWNGRSLAVPMHRFFVKGGETLTIPLVLCSMGDSAERVQVKLLRGIPKWNITLPESCEITPLEPVAATVKVQIPEDLLPGVEYVLRFAPELENGERGSACSVRIKREGDFPYEALANYHPLRDYPMWEPMKEPEMNSGRRVAEARNASVTVDGKLTEWDKEEFFELDQTLSWQLRDPDLPSPKDFSVRCAFRWDEQYLYVGFLVQDDNLSYLDAVSRDWRDNDNLRIFLSTEPDSEKRGEVIGKSELLLIASASDMELTGAPVAFSAVLGGFQRSGVERSLLLDSDIWEGGYAFELALPWSNLEFEPRAGVDLGLNVLADDADNGYRRHTSMMTLIRSDYWINPKSLGTLQLKGAKD